MRNLKKVLSLVLCLAVMLSVMVVGAGAAFSDQDKIENTEAVDACSALNIINGYEDGAFHPERNIKRAEVTKMICVALNGGEEPNTSTNAKPTFTDVRGTIYAWAEGYIEACVAQGIVDGVGGTRFAPASNVTGAQLAKMLLVSLGYNATTEKFTGNAWETNVNVRASQKHLYDGLEKLDTSAPVTRDQAAQMVWNAMQAYEVEYKDGVLQDKVVGTTNDKVTLLYDRYDAWVSVGTLTMVNSTNLSIAMSEADKVASDYYEKDSVVDFTKLDQDYSALLGQKVKVLFTAKNLDDVIGVFATKNNTVVTAFQNALDVENAKIKLDGKLYTLESAGVKVILDGEAVTENWHAVDFKDTNSPYVITLIDNDSNTKIDTAVVKTVDVAKVTFVSDKQIIVDRLENNGKVVSKTYKTADENIATGLAKDDFVVITHNLYKDNLDIVKADKATGTVDATKGPNSGYTDYQIDGTWYVAADNRDEINAAVKAGTKVDYVAVNGVLFYAEKATSTSDKLDDILFVAYVGQDGLSNEQARVMFPDGKKDTINLKDTSYDSNLDDKKDTPIVGGKFYEFNKSGNEYELLPVREYDSTKAAADDKVANKDHEDYYGAFTYYGTENLSFDGTAPASVDNVGKIDDNADVIVYQTQDKDGEYTADENQITKAVVKHITGKQLKSNKDILKDTSLVKATNGAFQSEVKGFDRASVLAVTYTGKWNSLENLTANANYGYIVKNAEKVAGGIQFDMITADDKEAITVFADESSTTNFDKGAVVGYSSITEATAPAGDEKLPVVNDLSFISDVTATYISETNDTDKVSVPGNAEMDLDDFTTVIYTKTYAGEIEKNANGAPAVAKDKRTNILYVGTEVAIIDANQIGGDVYAKNNITVEKFDDSASIEWTDATTGETWKGDVRDAYNNAVLNLSVTAKKDGKITLTVNGKSEVYDVVANKACKVDGIKVTGNVVLTWGDNAGGDVTGGNVGTGNYTVFMPKAKTENGYTATVTVAGKDRIVNAKTGDSFTFTATLDKAVAAGKSVTVTITDNALVDSPVTFIIGEGQKSVSKTVTVMVNGDKQLSAPTVVESAATYNTIFTNNKSEVTGLGGTDKYTVVLENTSATNKNVAGQTQTITAKLAKNGVVLTADDDYNGFTGDKEISVALSAKNAAGGNVALTSSPITFDDSTTVAGKTFTFTMPTSDASITIDSAKAAKSHYNLAQDKNLDGTKTLADLGYKGEADKGSKLTVTLTPVAGVVTEGTNVKVTAKMDAVTAGNFFKVTLTAGAEELTYVLKNGTLSGDASFTLKGDTTVTLKSIEKLAAPKIVDAKVVNQNDKLILSGGNYNVGDKLVITFDTAMNTSVTTATQLFTLKDNDSGNAALDTVTWSQDGTVVTIAVSTAALGENDTLTPAATLVDADGVPVADRQVITIHAAGTAPTFVK